MSDAASYRRILKSTSITGSASAVNVLIGLVRMKVAALVLGPDGIGLIGIFQNLAQSAAAISGLGIGTVGTRQIAEARASESEERVAAVRRTLLYGSLVLSSIGAFAFFALRGVFADHILHDSSLAAWVGWLALAVALMVGADSLQAQLGGLRRVGDLARVQVYAAILSTICGTLGLLLLGLEGVVVFVVVLPLSTVLFSAWFLWRLGPMTSPAPSPSQFLHNWSAMVRLGVPLMASGVALTLGQMAVRSFIQRDFGPNGLGQFQAAWAIAITYVGFVLSAMTTDYYPRLSAVITDRAAAVRLVNEQTEVALFLAGPPLVFLSGVAPWVVSLLYSGAFDDAAAILRWQILGDVLKVTSWPLGYVLLADAASGAFMCAEVFAIGAFVATTGLCLSLVGLDATGIAFLLMYVVYLPTVFVLARRRIGMRWSRSVLVIFGATLVATVVTLAISWWSEYASAGFGTIAALSLAGAGLLQIMKKSEIGGPARGLLNSAAVRLKKALSMTR